MTVTPIDYSQDHLILGMQEFVQHRVFEAGSVVVLAKCITPIQEYREAYGRHSVTVLISGCDAHELLKDRDIAVYKPGWAVFFYKRSVLGVYRVYTPQYFKAADLGLAETLFAHKCNAMHSGMEPTYFVHPDKLLSVPSDPLHPY